MDKRQRRGLWRLSAIFGVVTLTLAACTGGGSTSPSASAESSQASASASASEAAETPVPEEVAVTVLTDFGLFGWHSPLFAGKAEGIYDAQGIDLTIEGGRGSADGAAKVAAGAAEFGQIDIISALQAVAQGADLRIVAIYFQKHPGGMCYVPDRTSIESYADLEGLKIGAAAGDAYMVALPGLMEAAGADPSGYELVTMDPANTTPALVSGQVDASPCGLPTFPNRRAAAAEQGLGMEFFSFADNGFDTVGFGLVTSGAMVDENPDVVQRFVNAWAESAVWSLANGTDAVQAFVAANPDQKADLAQQSFDGVLPLLEGDDGYFVFDVDKLQATVDFVNEAYDANLKIDDVYTTEFVDQLPDAYKEGVLP